MERQTPKKSRTAGARAGGDQVQSLVRALALLNRIAESSDDGATLTDLAQQVGLPSSTAHRLLTTLEQERYSGRSRGTALVGRRPGLRRRLYVHQDPQLLAGIARPHMRHLMEDGGETVNLAVEDKGRSRLSGTGGSADDAAFAGLDRGCRSIARRSAKRCFRQLPTKDWPKSCTSAGCRG